jgi:hypothetical protein
MLVDKQRIKDLIDCINNKVKERMEDKADEKLKKKLIKECKKYFKGLKSKQHGYTIKDIFVFKQEDKIYIYRGSWGYTTINIFARGDIDTWKLEYVKKFYDNRDNILEKLSEEYGCENTLLTNKKLYRFW